MVEQFYRSFQILPYGKATLSQYQTGSGNSRYTKTSFNTLAGIANKNYLFGSPSGGTQGIITPNQDKSSIGGRRKKKCGCKKFGKGHGPVTIEDFINPPTLYHTYPRIGGTIY